MGVGADAKAFEVSSGSPCLRTIFQKQQWGQQRVYWKAEAARQEGKHHLSETMGMPLFHLGGTLLLILAEAHGVLEPPGHQSRGEWVQRLVALGLQSGGCWGEGHAPCAWLFGKSIVLLLLTKSQATCKSWLESTTGLVDWVIRFPSPTVLPTPPGSPPWHGPNARLGGGKQQCSCIESAVCRAQFMHYLNTG